MKIQLGNTSDGYNVLGKTYSFAEEITVNFKRDFNIYEPTIILTGDVGVLLEYNYFYIVELERYYYLSEQNVISNRLIEIRLRTDYLETYKDHILAANASYRRTITIGDMDNVDIEGASIDLVVLSYDGDVNLELGSELILTTVGG